MTARPRIVYPDADATVMESLASAGLLERLHALGDFVVHDGAPAGPDEFVRRVGDADAILLGSTLDDRVLEEAAALRAISFTGLGAANFVNLPLAAQREIAVTCTPGYGAVSVSEHALALLLAVCRNIVAGDAVVRAGGWQVAPGMQLAGKTAGIVGYGAIGKRFAQMLAALGMTVLVWARTPDPDAPAGIEFVPLDELFRSSDVVSLHLALNAATEHSITGELLDLLPVDAIVINTARSQIIEAGALEERLVAGRLRAGLDVFETEPLAEPSVLRGLPNVVLSPHQGYNTPEALASLLEIAVGNLENFFAGRPVHLA